MGAETILLQSQQQHTWGPLVLKSTYASHHDSTDTSEWPARVEGELVWDSNTFKSEDYFMITLNDDEVLEVKAALHHFNDTGLYGSEATPDTFPLPTLGPKLETAARDLHNGRGFVGVRGLKPSEFTPEDNVLIFLGISSYIGGRQGRQDEQGNMLMHLRNAKNSRTPQLERPTRYSNRASTFHTDTFCDILALQTRNNAQIGGANLLASSWTVYNKLMEKDPAIVNLLAQPNWSFDSRGSFFPCSTRPLLFFQDGHVIINFSREPLLGLNGVPRASGLPSLTQEQKEALDVVEQIAKENQIILHAEPGDLLFINNHAVLHSREAFSDSAENPNPRYLVRMWLKNEEMAWKLPQSLQHGNSRIYEDNELGERWNIMDVPRVDFKLSERMTS
ncbi:hypothetical protein QBC38DRAFT_44638 [Podospora fimiseda]|uniref:TauD/TfdA-like domain-containing protein n=1 Tax=Podospora fimiseda TaxID=252190 RepID=A0AAN7BHS6_9PEZI|nr:hypothetical protein QBC38DRAFT_44638 [Podospora fimiseda]